MRITRQAMYVGMARMASMRSTCSRLNVGAIITHRNSPVSIGWNGAEAGAPHCTGNDCPGMVPGQCPALHAERNALKKAEELLPFASVVDLYCTHSPCPMCIESMRNSMLDIERLFFEIPYRDTSGLGAINGEIEVYEVTPAGYIIDYFTRKVVELP